MASGSFGLLHENIQHWVYKQGWKELRPAQVKAIKEIRKGVSDLIIYAPTASGKTEAAFLPLLSNLLDFGLKERSYIIYISPLKALINDQWTRLQKVCSSLPIEVIPWHGDISNNIKDDLNSFAKNLKLIKENKNFLNKDLEKNIYLNDKKYFINLNILNFAINAKIKFRDFSETLKKILTSKTHKFTIEGKYLMKNGMQQGLQMGKVLKEIEQEWMINNFQITEKRIREIILSHSN